MKLLLTTTLLALTLGNLKARVLTCEDRLLGKYLLAVGETEVLVFKKEEEGFKELAGDLEVKRSVEAKGLSLTYKEKEASLSWGRFECYKWQKPSLKLEVRELGTNLLEGSARIIPNIIKNPSLPLCPTPRPVPAPTINMDCEYIQ